MWGHSARTRACTARRASRAPGDRAINDAADEPTDTEAARARSDPADLQGDNSRPRIARLTSERGVYEDSTTWSPSWTIGNGTIATSTIDDIATAAPAIFAGTLLSRKSRRELVRPSAISGNPFGFGVILANAWRLQNPSLNGYGGIMASLPQAELTVALTTTATKAASLAEASTTDLTFRRLADYMAPANPLPSRPSESRSAG